MSRFRPGPPDGQSQAFHRAVWGRRESGFPAVSAFFEVSAPVSITRKRMYCRFGDWSSPLAPTVCHANHSTRSSLVHVSTKDTDVTPAEYSLVTAIQPLPDKTQGTALAYSTPLAEYTPFDAFSATAPCSVRASTLAALSAPLGQQRVPKLLRQFVNGQARIDLQKPVVEAAREIMGVGVHAHEDVGSAGRVERTG